MSVRARKEFARFFDCVKYSAQLHGPKGVIYALRGNWILPRPRYCECCRLWAWCTDELAAYSTAHGFLCEDCAAANDKETEAAWRGFI